MKIDAGILEAFHDQLCKIAMTSAFFQEFEKRAEEGLEEAALRVVDKVRPYAYRGAMGAIPGAVLGGALTQSKTGPRVGLALGAGVGMADKFLEDMSARREYRKLLSSYQGDLKTKISGAESLSNFSRKFVDGNVLRGTTPAAAERSLEKSRKVGLFGDSIKTKVGQ